MPIPLRNPSYRTTAAFTVFSNDALGLDAAAYAFALAGRLASIEARDITVQVDAQALRIDTTIDSAVQGAVEGPHVGVLRAAVVRVGHVVAGQVVPSKRAQAQEALDLRLALAGLVLP